MFSTIALGGGGHRMWQWCLGTHCTHYRHWILKRGVGLNLRPLAKAGQDEAMARGSSYRGHTKHWGVGGGEGDGGFQSRRDGKKGGGHKIRQTLHAF